MTDVYVVFVPALARVSDAARVLSVHATEDSANQAVARYSGISQVNKYHVIDPASLLRGSRGVG